MATIKDVAKLAGTSVSTVSVAINTTPEQKKVAPATRARIMAAMRTLGYQPNVAARKLRMDSVQRPIIAIFWPRDHRGQMLGQIMSAFQDAAARAYFDCDILVYPYVSGKLSEMREHFISRRFNGAFIGATSGADLEFLQEMKNSVHVVLYNRYLDWCSTVVADTKASGILAAKLIEESGFRTVTLFNNELSTPVVQSRTDSFLKACQERGLQIISQYQITTDKQQESVLKATRQMLEDGHMGDVVLFHMTEHALVSIYELQRAGIKIPEDVRVLVMCTDINDTFKYFIPSVTAVLCDVREMLTDCFNILMHSIASGSVPENPIHKVYSPYVLYGDTFPEKN